MTLVHSRINQPMPPKSNKRKMREPYPLSSLFQLSDNLPTGNDKSKSSARSVYRVITRKWHAQNGQDVQDEARTLKLDVVPVFEAGPTELLTFMEGEYSNSNTRATQCGYLMRVLRVPEFVAAIGWTQKDVDVFDREHRSLKNAGNEQRMHNEAPAIVNDNNLQWQTFLDYEKQLRRTQYGSPLHVHAAIRALACPRRNEDYVKLHFITDDKSINDNTKNYVIIGSNSVRLRYAAHKTSKHHGILEFDVSSSSKYAEVCPELDDLARILRHSYDNNPRDVVFTNPEGNLAKITKAAYGIEGIGIRVLRRLHSAWTLRQNWTAYKLQLASDLVGHNIQQSMIYNIVIEEGDRDSTGAPIGQPNTSSDSDFIETLKNIMRTAIDLLQVNETQQAITLLKAAVGDDVTNEASTSSGRIMRRR